MRTFVLFFLLGAFNLIASPYLENVTLEVYLSSRDCTRCFTKLNEVIKVAQTHSNVDLKIIVDSKALRIKVLNEFNSIQTDLVQADTEKVNLFCADGRSKIKKVDADGSFEIIPLAFFKNSLLSTSKTEDNQDTLIIYRDDLFSGINVPMASHKGRIGFFNKVLQYFVLGEESDTNPTFNAYQYSISEKEFKEYKKHIENHLDAVSLLSYKQIDSLNKLTKLPLFNIHSFDMQEKKISIYKTLYVWYRDEASGDTINRGFIFHSTIQPNLTENSLSISHVELILPFEYHKELYAIDVYSPTLKINDSLFFRFVRCLSNPELNKSLDGRLLGLTYEIKDDVLYTHTHFHFDSFQYAVDHEVINNLPTYLHSNTNLISFFKSNLLVLNKSLNTAMDLSEATVMTIHEKFNDLAYDISSEVEHIRYFKADGSDYTLIYNDDSNKHFLLVYNGADQRMSQRRIKNVGRQIGVAKSEKYVYTLNVSLDEEFIEIHRYKL